MINSLQKHLSGFPTVCVARIIMLCSKLYSSLVSFSAYMCALVVLLWISYCFCGLVWLWDM